MYMNKRGFLWEAVMRVRQVDHALNLFELYAKNKTPLTLTAISEQLGMPKSSVFNLIETLVSRGFIYEIKQRGGYYPTRRLHDMSSEIMEGDVFLQHIHGELEMLSAATGETVLLAVRQGEEVLYVDVVEADSPIRYSAQFGERRPLYTTSTGKAILTTYSSAERVKILDAIDYQPHQDNTARNAQTLARDLDDAIARGWTVDRAEFTPDVMGIGVPLVHGSRRFGLAIAGPIYRMEYQHDRLGRMLKEAAERIQKIMSDGTGNKGADV
jgi:IclR family transcriptional regulator, acetate operon repressor